AALNGTDLGGRSLTINEAKPKTDRPKGGGQRFGGGGGGRGRDDYRGHPRQPRKPRWQLFSACLEIAGRCILASQRSTRTQGGLCMQRGRSTFTKRQKEQARQQKQRNKAERRNQRKQEKT